MIADMFLKTILRRSKQNKVFNLLFSSSYSIQPPYCINECFLQKVAIVDQNGEHTYKDIIDKSKVLSNHICKISKDISKPQRIGILCSNDVSYTICQWASWMSNSVCVPLASSHPLSSLLYILKDSECSLVVSDHHFKEKALEATQKLSVPYLEITNVLQTFFSDSYFEVKDTHKEEEEALIIYTSGTTGKPKGVIVSHGNLSAQKYLLEKAWEVSENDVFLHALPLHHVHGITNALLLPLWVGATVYMMPRFDAEKAWDVLLGDNSVNVLNAVPTIYFKLIESYKKKFVSQEEQKFVFDTLKKKMRVMISGSAALPQPVLEGWKKISSHILLERYGMSELGMVLTNPLQGKRIPGAVGLPFPSVEVRIVSEDKREILVEGDSDSIEINLQYQNEGTLSGDLHVKGPSLFKGYLNRPDATNESFTTDGWFLTGDVASYSKTENVFRILGRASVDIIKSGGYKMSALDIERHLLSHSLVTEAAVLGVPNDEWGQIVFALISTENNVEITLDTIQEYLKTKIPKYQIPKGIKLIETIPRNAMGKVNKKELLKDLLENNL